MKTAGAMLVLVLILARAAAMPTNFWPSPVYSHREKMHEFKAVFPVPDMVEDARSSAVYHVTSYGGDPTGNADSTHALLTALSDVLNRTTTEKGFLMEGIVNRGGARIDLDGGNYLISAPLQFPISARGNIVIAGGSLTASADFPNDGYLIDMSPPVPNNSSEFNYEFITMRDLLLDSNFRGGGIHVANSLRITIDNCYLTHFNTTGISVEGGHETYIRNSYLGQHITAGGDPGERVFSGTGIVLNGNDNAVTDVVIFSAATGILVQGQANTLSGVHCYNKAYGYGGTGIYLQVPNGPTQTRIINAYLDYTRIVAEDPMQVTISNSFFLGDAHIVLKSMKGVVNGVNIVDNAFSGLGRGVEIVQVEGKFTEVDQVVIDRNNVNAMKVKATIGRASVQGNDSTWIVDFNSVLLFPNLIKQVHYTFLTNASYFPLHALRNTSDNKVVIQSDKPVPATVHITADQTGTYQY